MEYDVFISHAREEKDAVARPLAARLGKLGVKVWLDEIELKLGDSLSLSIEKGLLRSKFGVVVLSQNFFKKQWTQRELDALLLKEETTEKVILPIWHNITEEEVSKFNPLLVDKISVSTEKGIDYIARQIISVVKQETSLESAIANIAAYNEPRNKIRFVPEKKIKPALTLTNLQTAGLTILLVGIILGTVWLTAPRFGYTFKIEPTKNEEAVIKEEILENPAEVIFHNCEFKESLMSCKIFNTFTDKRITTIEVEVKLATPDGDKIVRPQLSTSSGSDSHNGNPLHSSTYTKEWSYNPKDSSLNSRNIKVTVKNTTPGR